MNLPNNISDSGSKNTISISDIIIKLREWFRYLLGKWWFFVLAGIIGAGLGLTYSLIRKTNYVGDLSFVMEESKSNPLGAYAGLASQFGIDLSGGGSSGVFSGDNILEFLKSRMIVEKTLLSTVEKDKKKISLADYYIDIYGLNRGQSHLAYFPLKADRNKFSLEQDSMLHSVYDQIVKNNLIVTKPDKKLGFILVRCVSVNEKFSKFFVESLVNEAITFYVDIKTQRSKANIGKLQAKADSIELLLNRKSYSAALEQDLNLNPGRRIATVNAELIGRDKLVLQTMYGEVIKNLEMSKMAMAQETPIIQIVDTPILPLKKEKLGKLKGMFLGVMVFELLCFLVLVVRKVYQTALGSHDANFNQ